MSKIRKVLEAIGKINESSSKLEWKLEIISVKDFTAINDFDGSKEEKKIIEAATLAMEKHIGSKTGILVVSDGSSLEGLPNQTYAGFSPEYRKMINSFKSINPNLGKGTSWSELDIGTVVLNGNTHKVAYSASEGIEAYLFNKSASSDIIKIFNK